MLNDFPIQINNVPIPFPNEWTENSEVVENVARSESGTDIVVVTRFDKLSISCSLTVMSDWLAQFQAWSQSNTLALKRYDAIDNAYDTRTVRMRNFKCQLKPKSHKIAVTTGIWIVSFTLEEI